MIVYYWYYYLLGIILIPGLILSIYAQSKVNSSFSKYLDKIPTSDILAHKVARHILDSAGLYDYKVTKCRGTLTDHFNPKTKTVSLSEDVYDSSSVSALGVMAHELGHVMQYKDNYPLMKLRTFLVPFINITTYFMWPLVILGVIFEFASTTNLGKIFIIIAIVIFSLSTVLSLITLPLEKDASKRAQSLLYNTGILNEEECKNVKEVLSAAALTYFAGLITSVLSLIRFILYILMITKNDN